MLQQANGKPLIRYAFILYAVMVAWLLLGRSRFDIGRDYWEQVSLNLNLVPFETVRRYLVVILHRTNPYMLPHALMNVLGNLAFFMPFGFLAPCLWKKCGIWAALCFAPFRWSWQSSLSSFLPCGGAAISTI